MCGVSQRGARAAQRVPVRRVRQGVPLEAEPRQAHAHARRPARAAAVRAVRRLLPQRVLPAAASAAQSAARHARAAPVSPKLHRATLHCILPPPRNCQSELFTKLLTF